ncbi:hypothetical protein GOP47_0020119 [Adiantum capillus-veneris]|uniref:Uncharacterized protein n=1 Tax=Adiantum capillus-veneris TaxID=13818 RepID=A0A9D4Z8D1_ADICA|nr:hypothetical protein GOP47_0020119 [Adiantum capillus-veneris]
MRSPANQPGRQKEALLYAAQLGATGSELKGDVTRGEELGGILPSLGPLYLNEEASSFLHQAFHDSSRVFALSCTTEHQTSSYFYFSGVLFLKDQGDHKERDPEANPKYLLNQNQALSGKSYPHAVEQKGSIDTSILLHNEHHHHGLQDSTMETEQRFQVIDIWKNNSDNKSDTIVDLTKSFPAREEAK